MNETKRLFKKAIATLLNSQGTDEVLSEAALPAYAHKNPIIDYIFWERLSVASSFIDATNKTNCKILDFGCGTGVFSYEMAKKGHRLYAVDLDLKPVRLLQKTISYPETIQFTQGDFFDLDFEEKTFDFIVAFDVLEHIAIDALPGYLEKFNQLLKPDGYIVISGPTENILYKIGRKLAGNDFTGEYHETTIAKIKEVFNLFFTVKTLRRLIWPFILFEIFSARKK